MNGFPEGWIIKLPRCLPAKKFPTSASGRQDRGPVTLLGFRRSFHLTGVDPTVVSPAAILKQEHSFLIANLKAGISVVKSAWRQGCAETLRTRELPAAPIVLLSLPVLS